MAHWSGQACFVRAGDPLVLHVVPDWVEDSGWGQAICGEASFSWECAGAPEEAVGSPCPACLVGSGQDDSARPAPRTPPTGD